MCETVVCEAPTCPVQREGSARELRRTVARVERQVACNHGKGDNAEAPDIGGRPDVALPTHDLGRCVRRRAAVDVEQHARRHDGGETKVNDLHVVVSV